MCVFDDVVGICNYKVSYVDGEDVLVSQEVNDSVLDSYIFALSSLVPFKDGYMFLGWSEDDEELMTSAIEFDYVDEYDMELVLHAVYKEFK